STENAEAAEAELEAEVNYIGGTGFQKPGNQFGNQNFNGYGQKSSFNQNPQYQKPFNNNKNYGNSHYQNPPQQTQENKIEAMLYQVLEGQQKLTVDFNGKFDSIYKDLDTKMETLGTQVRKLETQVVQNEEAI